MNAPLSPDEPAVAPRTKRAPRGRSRAILNSAPEQRARFERRIPTFELLDDAGLQRIEAQADWILAHTGFEFRGDSHALALFDAAGAAVDGARVRFEPGAVRALCASAPSQFELHGRDPLSTVVLGGNHLVLMPGYGAPFVSDLDRGRRYAQLADFKNFAKMTYVTPWLHHGGGVLCEPVDVPLNKRHLDMTHAQITLSTKPFMGAVTAPERAHDTLAMARLAFGENFVADHAVMQANININSPLVFDETMSKALRIYASAGQCVCVSPAIFGGAMGPVTPAAIAAQTLAEGMMGIALAQLVRPGCPVVLGSFHSTMNLRSGALTFGTPEANLVTMLIGQLGRRLGVPVRSGGGQITAANAPDGAAMQDSANAMWASLITGANQVWHACGWLEGGLTMSYEKFVMDLDNCGAMLKLLSGIATDEDALGRDAYGEVGPGENFLSCGHTLRHYAHANYESLLPDTGPYETWRERGSPSAAARANAHWKAMLAAYEPPPTHPGMVDDLTRFVAERKASMPDAWY